MFNPPPGFEDLRADADRWPVTGTFRELHVPRVGPIRARPPAPRAAADLGMSIWHKAPPGEQHNALVRFLMDHLDEGEYERVIGELVEDIQGDDLPTDTVQRVARTIACCDTARPYAAVTTLSLYTNHSWRAVRYKMTMAGIIDPMGLPSLHSVLDVTEQIVVESLLRSGEERDGPPSKGEMKVQSFYDQIYRPDIDDDGIEFLDEEPFVPAGFEDPDDMEDSFDSFAAFGR